MLQKVTYNSLLNRCNHTTNVNGNALNKQFQSVFNDEEMQNLLYCKKLSRYD